MLITAFSTLSAPLSSIVPCLEQDGTHSPMWETSGVNLKEAEMFPQMLSCRQRLLVWIICVLDSLQAALWSETINRKQHSGHMQKKPEWDIHKSETWAITAFLRPAEYCMRWVHHSQFAVSRDTVWHLYCFHTPRGMLLMNVHLWTDHEYLIINSE